MSLTVPQGPKRFYGSVACAPQPTGHAVLLDGRSAKTPGGAPLHVPTAALAGLVAQEWEAQGEGVVFASMPLTRLSFTAIDRAPTARRHLVRDVARHVLHDVVCHLAEGPEKLTARQEAAWAPWRVWARTALAAPLIPVRGVAGGPQSPEAYAAAEARASSEGDFVLTGLAAAAALFGSGVLAFALRHGAADADAAFDASRVDEAFQEEAWGLDREAVQRTEALRREARRLEAWFKALEGAERAVRALGDRVQTLQELPTKAIFNAHADSPTGEG